MHTTLARVFMRAAAGRPLRIQIPLPPTQHTSSFHQHTSLFLILPSPSLSETVAQPLPLPPRSMFGARGAEEGPEGWRREALRWCPGTACDVSVRGIHVWGMGPRHIRMGYRSEGYTYGVSIRGYAVWLRERRQSQRGWCLSLVPASLMRIPASYVLVPYSLIRILASIRV